MQAHQIKFPRTAHYYTLGEPSPETQHLLFVLHGYGQLASQFVYKFDRLGTNYCVVAPEGFSRFYWNQTSGTVGASWMTKLDRLAEIEDYTNYLQHLYHSFRARLAPAVPTTVLGFSQGGATAMRWLHRLQPEVQRLMLWGAGIPTDLDYRGQVTYWQALPTHLIWGKQDEYFSQEKYDAHQVFLQTQPLQPQTHWYEGKHRIDRDVLQQVLEVDF